MKIKKDNDIEGKIKHGDADDVKIKKEAERFDDNFSRGHWEHAEVKRQGIKTEPQVKQERF